MTDYEDLQKRCQRGATNLNDANNLLAECYGVLGKLGAENQALRKLLLEASEEVYAWGAYASAYFQEKHDLEGCVAKFHAAAMSKQEAP